MPDGEASGGFVLVVGPSGAGKDTLIRLARHSLRDDPRLHVPRRVVTRPGSAEEEHETLSPAAFEAAAAAGAFCLHWRAHGLAYGIPASAGQAASNGALVLCNVSRTVLAEARQRLPAVTVVEVTAPAEILVHRIAARDRRWDGDPATRLARRVPASGVPPEVAIVNDAEPEAAAGQLIAHLRARCAQIGLPRRQEPGRGAHPTSVEPRQEADAAPRPA